MRARNAGAGLKPARTLGLKSLLVCAVLLSLLALLSAQPSPTWAGCDHTCSNIIEADANGSIHTTDADYYRGEIHTFDRAIGICRVTAYLSAVDYTSGDLINYVAKIWSVNDENLATLLGVAEDVYQGGNWTEPTPKTFHFYNPVRVPAGLIAITISDDSSVPHPSAYHVWHRAPSQTGHKACAWTSAGYSSVSRFDDLNVATDTDNTTLVWSGTWTKQSSGSHDGVDVAQSATIGSLESSSISTSVEGPGTLAFWWNVSSEAGYDYLSFYIDDVLQTGQISGPSHEWEQKSYEIPSGAHTLRWTYSKDVRDSSGADTAWLDQVEYSNVQHPQVVSLCTSAYSQMMAITYVETPFLTADWSYTGWPRMEIPEWAPYGANYCDMRDDNITVACELPEDLPSGNHKLKGRFCQSDDNANRCSGWAYLRYRVVKSGETVTSVQNHPSGEATATITGEYR